jgi:hypothetical protein
VKADRPLAFQGLALITLMQPSAIATAPTSYTCGVKPKYNLNAAFGVNVIPSIRARPAIDATRTDRSSHRLAGTSPAPRGQERIAIRTIPPRSAASRSTPPSKVRLPHAPHRGGEIIVPRSHLNCDSERNTLE